MSFSQPIYPSVEFMAESAPLHPPSRRNTIEYRYTLRSTVWFRREKAFEVVRQVVQAI
jgi:hypothetical protein